jgi:DNA-binding beta-propeller fold protein YncE
MRSARNCLVQVIALLSGVVCSCPAPSAQAQAAPEFSTTEKVGILGTNRYYTPANQILTPAGLQVELPGMRPQALALSPNGRLLVTAGKSHELVVLDPANGKVLQHVPLPGSDALQTPNSVSQEILHPDKAGQLSFTGLAFSPDGGRLYLANVDGDIKAFEVTANGQVVGRSSIALPPAKAPRRRAEIPAGLAVSKDGKRLYVALNLSNRLVELDADSGRVLRLWEVGVAPYAVALAGQKVYVSNWGGRRPDAQSTTGPAGQGTLVRVDPVRHIASEGSVSVVDLKETGKSEGRNPKAEGGQGSAGRGSEFGLRPSDFGLLPCPRPCAWFLLPHGAVRSF